MIDITHQYKFDYRSPEWAERTERMIAEQGVVPSHVRLYRKVVFYTLLLGFLQIVTIHAWELKELSFKTQYGIEEKPKRHIHYTQYHIKSKK